MTGFNDAFWDRIDARIAATATGAPERRRAPATPPTAPLPPQAEKPRRAERPLPAEETPDRHRVADWTGLVDTISAAGAAAQEQTAAYETLAGDLRRALAEVERYKALVVEAQAQVEVKSRQIQALAEARIEAIQATADARVQRAEERAAIADQRVVVVEDWLAKFEQASRALLPDPAPAQTRRFGGSAAA
jgi:hypothetical protein